LEHSLKIAIALTLFVAAATSVLGAFQKMRDSKPRGRIGAALGVVFAIWFTFAGMWLLIHK